MKRTAERSRSSARRKKTRNRRLSPRRRSGHKDDHLHREVAATQRRREEVAGAAITELGRGPEDNLRWLIGFAETDLLKLTDEEWTRLRPNTVTLARRDTDDSGPEIVPWPPAVPDDREKVALAKAHTEIG